MEARIHPHVVKYAYAPINTHARTRRRVRPLELTFLRNHAQLGLCKHSQWTEQGMRGGIICGSPGVLPCRTVATSSLYQVYCVLSAGVLSSRTGGSSGARLLSLAGDRKDRGSPCNGTTIAVATAACPGRSALSASRKGMRSERSKRNRRGLV